MIVTYKIHYHSSLLEQKLVLIVIEIGGSSFRISSLYFDCKIFSIMYDLAMVAIRVWM